jgi:hypothetical protein
VTTATNDVHEIRRQMARIRRELHEDVREVVTSAEAVTDWRRYIRMYPWASLGVTFAVGYLIVPKRRRIIPDGIATQADLDRVREAVEESREQSKAKSKKGLLGSIFGLIGPVAVHAAQTYAVQYLESWLARQVQQQRAAGPSPIHPQAPGGPGPKGGPGNMGGTGWAGGTGGVR